MIDMELRPGMNSYVTLDEADAYVSASRVIWGASGSHAKLDAIDRWGNLTPDEKQALLVRACAEIDSLPFVGQKRDRTQSLSFPRWPTDQVPESVKQAQIELVLTWFDPSAVQSAQSANKRMALQRQGVTSYSVGDLSESYDGAANWINQHPCMAHDHIRALLYRYLQGGFEIC